MVILYYVILYCYIMLFVLDIQKYTDIPKVALTNLFMVLLSPFIQKLTMYC
jgi:hypothetical protein